MVQQRGTIFWRVFLGGKMQLGRSWTGCWARSRVNSRERRSGLHSQVLMVPGSLWVIFFRVFYGWGCFGPGYQLAVGGMLQQSWPGTVTPTAIGNHHIPSIASVMSDLSGYDTSATHPSTPFLALLSPNWHLYAMPISAPKQQGQQEPKFQQLLQHHIKISKDDFGLSHMMAVIECKSTQPRTALLPLHPTDELLFGRLVDLEGLHPSVREIYGPGFKQLEEFDKVHIFLRSWGLKTEISGFSFG